MVLGARALILTQFLDVGDEPQRIVDEFGVDLLIVWPAAAVKEQIADAKRHAANWQPGSGK